MVCCSSINVSQKNSENTTLEKIKETIQKFDLNEITRIIFYIQDIDLSLMNAQYIGEVYSKLQKFIDTNYKIKEVRIAWSKDFLKSIGLYGALEQYG